jgi:hypothetical protein
MKKLCTCGVGGDYHAARHGARSANQSCVRGKSTITAHQANGKDARAADALHGK